MCLGLPASALRMTVTRYKGEGHAVLVVQTTKGDCVLDNLDARVLHFATAGDHIRRMSSSIKGRASPPDPGVWTFS